MSRCLTTCPSWSNWVIPRTTSGEQNSVTPHVPLFLRKPPDHPQVQIAPGSPALHALGNGRPKLFIKAKAPLSQLLGFIDPGELLRR